MFTKLLKHEWRATRGVIGLLCVIILISGLTIGGIMHYMVKADNTDGVVSVVSEEEDVASYESPMSNVVEIACVLLVVAGVFAVAVCCAGSVFFVIWRFYKSRFTDEGYLTFTLPVNNHQLLLSSILNSIFGVLIVIVAAVAAVLIAVALFLLAFPQNLIWGDVAVSLGKAMSQLWNSFVKNWDVLLSLGLSAILAGLSQLIVIMLSVTIGSIITKKHKILAAVGVYYGIGIVRSFVCGISMLNAVFVEDVTRAFSVYDLVALVTIVAGYLLMYHLIDRKLNLA
ncbi:MAG: hypothetical protein ACI3V0_11595 [Faecousia sp.]